jgi:hypothetical protein
MNYVFILTIAEYFLWGVFRALENSQTLNKADGEDTPFISPLECVSNDHTVDMEIDMVGGETVGRADTVVSKDASRRDVSVLSSGDNKSRGDFALELPLQSSNGKCFTVEQFDIPPGFEKIARTKLKDAGKCFTVEQFGLPPGFEKIARMKLKDTSCKGSVKKEI